MIISESFKILLKNFLFIFIVNISKYKLNFSYFKFGKNGIV